MVLLGLILGIPVSLLPGRWQQRWFRRTRLNLERSAMLSGLLQFGACLRYFVLGFVAFHAAQGSATADVVQSTQHSLENFGSAFRFEFFDYVLHPLPAALTYFAIEGLARFGGALVAGECIGTLPLWIVAIIAHGTQVVWNEVRLGPRIIDDIQWGDGSEFTLRIASCRPKYHWDQLVTVVYANGFYEVASEERTKPPRPFVYLLRPKPPMQVIRALHIYSPDEVIPRWMRNKATQEQVSQMAVIAARSGSAPESTADRTWSSRLP